MAINVMQQQPKVTGSRGTKGSSKMGALGGALLGGALVAGTGGAAAPAVLGAAATGASLGGLLGGAIDPGRPDTRQAIQRRVEGIGQQTAQLNPQQTMQDALIALRQAGDPQLIRQYAPPIVQGLAKTMVG